ncbi:acylneuraminate cytidylyltransferase family protein [Candidatus Woesearchaeota archaeon]|jgi:N-acylneuraminate cytidylyltransferase|nr:acylneuraminate cytidylyltransferase family protein [Candidatus Woesearchaeota archaeon]
MNTCAFIFARGGSKGLPGKNIKLLLGKPLIQYSIEIAFQTSDIDKVFVSTDNADIAKVALESGAIIIKRPSELAQDDSPEWSAWQHAISWVKAEYGDFNNFVSLPATSPLRSVKDVELAILKKDAIGADICIGITPSNRNPYFNMVKALSTDLVELVNKPINAIYRRQDAPEVFDITTVVYVSKVEFIMNNNSIFDGSVTSVEIPKYRAVDIDDIYDFQLAELILKGVQTNENN